ncbi:MAG: hypothetical protein IID39_05805, partial [Planctomycetes bacterium]|nr:hypothetical protein [Planctomycetota bacterium]
MKLKNCFVSVVGCALCVSIAAAGPARPGAGKRVDIDPEAALYDFQQANPQAKLHRISDQITRIYGSAFGYGDSPEETAEQFRLDHAEMFGVGADDLDPRGPLADERHTQDVMYDRQTGRYKFTLVYYTQYESGLPVLGADLRLLVRNEPGYPLVLAASSLRDLGTFSVGRVEPIDFERAKQSAAQKVPGLIKFGGPRRVIWAGVDGRPGPPTVAIEFVADNGRRGAGDYARWLFVTDARSGEILYEENLILNADVIGNISAMATQGIGADLCEAEALEAMPFARVSVQGGNTAFADANGDFVIPNAGSDPVTVESPVRGRWFRVFNQGGPDTVLTTNVIPPGPADFIHNQANNNEFARAEVNGYVEANVARDFA